MSTWLAHIHRNRSTLLLGALVAVFALTYGVTLLSGIHDFGDTTKAQFIGHLWGTTHPTGYPLYILLTGAFSWLPGGTLALKANLFSALCSLGALALLYGVQLRLQVCDWIAAMTCAALGWSRTFWSQSIIAEVYALNCLLLAGTLYCFVNWRITRRQAWFVAACAVYAFSFGNHLTAVTLLPAFVFGTFAGDWSVLKRPKLVVLVVSATLAALSLYAYPLWRSQAGSVYLEYHLNDLSELIDYVTGERYRGKMFAFGSEEVLFQRLPRFIGQIVSELGLLGLLIPAGALACKDGWVRGVLGLGFLGELLWIACYDIPDIQVYIMPVALLGATFAGLALDAMAQRGRLRTALVGVVAALGVLVLPYYNLARMSNDKAASFSEDVTRQLDYLGERAVIVGRINYSLRMAYIYHLYAEGLSEKRELHLCDNTDPSTVAAYLRGEASLKDSYTKQRLPAGLRVFISDRAAKEGWTRQKDYRVGPRVEQLRELSSLE